MNRDLKENFNLNNKQSEKEISIFEILTNKGFKKIMTQDLLNLELEWLVENFLVKQSLVMIYAGAGSGKSYFALYLSKFLLENNKIDNIFYLDADNSKSSLKERKVETFLELLNLHYYFVNNHNKYTIFKDLQQANLKNTLIVIDSIRNFIKDDFNKDCAMVKFFDELQRLRDSGATIIFLHHQPKQMQDENNKIYKGATAFLDSVDEGYFLNKKDIKENEEFVVLLESQKRRFNVKPHAFKINSVNQNFEFADYLKYGESQKACITLNLVKEILSENKEGLNQQDLASQIKKRVELDYIEIIGRNSLWKLLDKYKDIYFNINYESPQNKGGKKKIFKLLE